jgi:polyphosphate kinase
MSSADWMPRNFYRRVEAMVPVEDPVIRARLVEILQLACADNAKSWLLTPEGKYERVQPRAGVPIVRAQSKFVETTRDRVKAAEASATSGRYSLSRLASPRGKADDKSPDGRRARRDAKKVT